MKKCSVLIVEDDKHINAFYSYVFEQEGIASFSAYNIDDAKKIFEKERPEFVLLDLMVGRGSGFDFLNKFSESTTVLVVSNLKDKKDECLKLGAYKFFLKSKTDPDEFIKIIKGDD